MIGWNHLVYFGAVAIVCWIVGACAALRGRRKPAFAVVWTLLGSAVFMAFIAGMWVSLERPPLRTVGETRLWYSLFVTMVGAMVYGRWRYRWILLFSTLMSAVFICINILSPQIHDKTLMPALQSVWFIPHVVVYMFAYALLGAVTLFALYLWLHPSRKEPSADEMRLCDELVRTGSAFLCAGMVMGALWAKQAWGDFWTWDPKETWAAATWLGYLLYIHLRGTRRIGHNAAFALIVFSFLLLQMCWWGVNYLPSAQGASMHVY